MTHTKNTPPPVQHTLNFDVFNLHNELWTFIEENNDNDNGMEIYAYVSCDCDDDCDCDDVPTIMQSWLINKRTYNELKDHSEYLTYFHEETQTYWYLRTKLDPPLADDFKNLVTT